jgi:hypothetical protein
MAWMVGCYDQDVASQSTQSTAMVQDDVIHLPIRHIADVASQYNAMMQDHVIHLHIRHIADVASQYLAMMQDNVIPGLIDAQAVCCTQLQLL